MGIPIDHYVRFDFNGFVELVDALGGVEVEIDCPYYDYFQIEDVVLNVKPGLLVAYRRRSVGLCALLAWWRPRSCVPPTAVYLGDSQPGANENILTKLPARLQRGW